MLQVSELFYSIQGESTWAGRPCVFLRLVGCNLNCRYCDSNYARKDGETHSLRDLTSRVLALDTPLVEITGGEPLLQPEINRLCTALTSAGCTLLVETNGSLLLPAVRDFHAILDWKTPGSGHPESFRRDNLTRLRPDDEVKFVICDRRDFDWSVERLDKIPSPVQVLFSPAAALLEPKQLAEWILDARIRVRLQLQLHKLLWPDTDRGV